MRKHSSPHFGEHDDSGDTERGESEEFNHSDPPEDDEEDLETPVIMSEWVVVSLKSRDDRTHHDIVPRWGEMSTTSAGQTRKGS